MTVEEIRFNSRLRSAAMSAVDVLCEQMKTSLPLGARVEAAKALLDAHVRNERKNNESTQ